MHLQCVVVVMMSCSAQVHMCVSLSGGWEGQANFKMSFPSGGAIELGQHLFKLATNGEGHCDTRDSVSVCLRAYSTAQTINDALSIKPLMLNILKYMCVCVTHKSVYVRRAL